MRKRLLAVIGVICSIGAVLAALSTQQHYRLLAAGFEQESFCVIGGAINCDLVNGSTYAELFGIPLAVWGMVYYGLLAAMSLFAAASRGDRRATVMMAFFMAAGGIPFCLYLAYVAFFIIGAVCVECIGMYAVNIAAAAALFAALKIPIRRIPRVVVHYLRAIAGSSAKLGFKPALIPHALFIGICFGAAWLAALSYGHRHFPEHYASADIERQIAAHYVQSIHHIEPRASWAVWGNPQQPVAIVEFSEFQCPFCRLSAFTVRPYLQEFHNDLAYYFVNFPLDAACNPAVSTDMHPVACYACRAGICADKRGKFWEYHDELFRNQQRLTKGLVLGIATDRFGWDRNEFQRCIDDPAIGEELSRQIEAGQKIHLRGTPSIFINGRPIKDWRNKRFLQELIREEIRRSAR